MRIAILGWGSLVWNKRDLSIRGRFKTGGPKLPLEFFRKSSDGRLTLIIDESHGMPSVPTRYAISRFQHLEDAICDLQHREGTGPKNIGFMRTGGEEQKPPKSKVAKKAIADWLKGNQKTIDAVIWTDLGPNESFLFSCEAVERGVCRERRSSTLCERHRK